MINTTELRPLFLVDALAKGVGEEVTYAYDDLAFISHSEVLIQFAETPKDALHFFIHSEIEEDSFVAMKAKYEIVAKGLEITLIFKGRFTLTSKSDTEEIDIKFFPQLD